MKQPFVEIYDALRAKEALGRELGHLNARGQRLLAWLRRRYAR
jgi:hypothetical protein